MSYLTISKLDENDQIPWDLILLADPSKEVVEKYLPDSDIYLAYFESDLIGEYVLQKVSDDEVELMNVAINEKHQGIGYGKELVLDAINRAKDSGMKSIKVGTGNSSFSQLALYQKCGFRIVGIEKDFFTNNYLDEIIENGIKCIDKVILEIKFNS